MPLNSILFITLLAILWLWESKQPFFTWQHNRYRHAAHNLALTIFNAAITFFLFASLLTVTAQMTQEYKIGFVQILPEYIPDIVRLFLGLILLDCWMYLWHRANHTIPLLWRFHRTHHSDKYMDATSATRFHTGELIMATVLRIGIIFMLGLTATHLLIYGLLLTASTLFHHANISIGRFDKILVLFIVTPDMHKIHHSRVMDETNSNYSTILSIWDRLGGTYKSHNKPEMIQIGLNEFDNEEDQTFIGMLKIPFLSNR